MMDYPLMQPQQSKKILICPRETTWREGNCNIKKGNQQKCLWGNQSHLKISDIALMKGNFEPIDFIYVISFYQLTQI